MSVSSRRALTISSVIVLAAVVFFVYASSLTTGFFADDYNFLEPVARLNLSDYLIHYFDPSVQVLWYRPLQGIQILLEWKLFGANAIGYHFVNLLFHALNCTLLFAIIWRISKKWHLAFAAALFYATFPVYALAVNWINITDPLATIFYLLGIWFWWSYLENGKQRNFALTLSALGLGLLSKQMVITLPVILFLLDRLLFSWRVQDQGSPMRRFLAWLDIPQILHRYWVFAVILVVFAGLQYGTQSTHTFAAVFGYSPDSQMLSILVQYGSLSVFPWGYFTPNDTQITEGMPFSDERNLLWLGVAILLYLFITWRTRSRVLVFLGLAWLVMILPVLPFPFIELRYLYLPIMTSGIVLGLLFDRVVDLFHRPRVIGAVAGIVAVLIVAGSSISITNANAGIYEIARQRRVPFRDIAQMHPTFTNDTHLYFIDSISPLSEMMGLFTLRYGSGVTVGGNDAPDPRPRLREHAHAFVYYFDETGKPHEVAVESTLSAQPSFVFPIDYQEGIRLEDVELASATVRQGDVLVALLSWRALGKIDKDYTMFVHLVDKNGQIAASYDSQPRSGKLPTHEWVPNGLVVDSIVLRITSDVKISNDYRLEIGVYEYPSLRRLGVVGDNGQVIDAPLVIAPLSVVEN